MRGEIDVIRKLLTAAVAVVLLGSGLAGAAEFPKDRQIRMVVPYGAGGGVDTAARILAAPAQEILGQRVDVVCMPGAGGQEGINFVLNEQKDGYTLLVTDYGPLVTTALVEDVAYDLSEWVPIVQITEVIPTFFVKSSSELKSVKDWVDAAAKTPGKYMVAHGRHLSVPHLPLILFEDIAKIQNTHVPTSGGSEALAMLLGGKVEIGASVPSTIASSVRAGEVRALAVCSEARAPMLPDVPTMKESGYDVVFPAWYTVFAHKDVPEENKKFLEEKFIAALNSASSKELAAKANVDLIPMRMEPCRESYDGTIENLKKVLELVN